MILRVQPLSLPWWTADPFLFCVHHDDAYPAGNDRLGPVDSLDGRNIGMDFEGKDGWRMYHGDVVPGFPQHPHRGFETITIARNGYIDHSDSLGATGRFGHGDVQWMTAGKGVNHSEMFPLVHPDRANPTELFQIWLNLPRASKMVEAHYKMLWAEDIPRHTLGDDAGRETVVTVIAGHLRGLPEPLAPPPDSWAAQPESEVGVWTVKMAPGASWVVPPASAGVNRVLYPFAGGPLTFDDREVAPGAGVQVSPEAPLSVTNGPEASELLILQGRPIGEPVAQYGPFVMNTKDEIREAIGDYQRTGFGGWPWPTDGPVHPRDTGRFAKYADGTVEERDG